MKRLYLIGGTMGVGKSTVCEILNRKLPHSIFLDGDWCWNADPFVVTDETKSMVMGNIAHLLTGFIRCSAYENIVFCWVMHEQAIIDDLCNRIPIGGVEVAKISLVCNEVSLKERLQKDVENGRRNADGIEKSVARLPLYRALDTHKIDTTEKCAEAVADEIIRKYNR